MERKLFHLTVSLIIFKDNKVLLMRRCNTKYMNGMYSLVGGHVEENESLKQAIIRESKEELGIDIIENSLKIVCMIRNDNDNNYFNFFLGIDNFDGIPKIMENDKCDELKWFNINNLPGNMIPADKLAIEKYLSGYAFDEYCLDNGVF